MLNLVFHSPGFPVLKCTKVCVGPSFPPGRSKQVII